MQAGLLCDVISRSRTGYRHLRRRDSHLAKGIKKNNEGERRIKGIAMAQWVNHLRNNIFVNLPPLPLSYEISGALNLAQLGLTAGWLAGRQAG